MKIYTKTGDKGTTLLFTGRCVPKDCPYMDALGHIDETNSTIGLAISQLPTEKPFHEVRAQLEHIQHTLFDLGAAVATPIREAKEKQKAKTAFSPDFTGELEQWIDKMACELPVLTQFILPGGHPAGAALHLARCQCRRAERQIVPLERDGDVGSEPMIFLNRLSDYLFMAARRVNQLTGVPETSWQR